MLRRKVDQMLARRRDGLSGVVRRCLALRAPAPLPAGRIFPFSARPHLFPGGVIGLDDLLFPLRYFRGKGRGRGLLRGLRRLRSSV